MPVFQYRAGARSGAVVTGQVQGIDRADAVAQLRADGAMPLRVRPQSAAGLVALLNTEITPRDALGTTDRIGFTRTLATLTGAGMPLDRALGSLRDLGSSRAVRALAGRLLDRVREGAALSAALAPETQAFPPYVRAMIRAGEAGARLEATLEELAYTMERTAARRGAFRSALIYPAFLIVTAIGSVALLLGYVVPTFQPLLDDAGAEPPPVTRAVIAAGAFVEAWGLWLLAALALAGLAFRLALRHAPVRLTWHRTLLRLPVIGRVLIALQTGQMARLSGALLAAGVSLPQTLRLTAETLSNAAFRAALVGTVAEVEAGRGLARPLRDTGLFPPLALQLTQAGEDSGDLAPMLSKTGEIFEADARRALDQALALLTPVLTLVMGGLIALIISAILFALFSINELAL